MARDGCEYAGRGFLSGAGETLSGGTWVWQRAGIGRLMPVMASDPQRRAGLRLLFPRSGHPALTRAHAIHGVLVAASAQPATAASVRIAASAGARRKTPPSKTSTHPPSVRRLGRGLRRAGHG